MNIAHDPSPNLIYLPIVLAMLVLAAPARASYVRAFTDGGGLSAGDNSGLPWDHDTYASGDVMAHSLTIPHLEATNPGDIDAHSYAQADATVSIGGFRVNTSVSAMAGGGGPYASSQITHLYLQWSDVVTYTHPTESHVDVLVQLILEGSITEDILSGSGGRSSQILGGFSDNRGFFDLKIDHIWPYVSGSFSETLEFPVALSTTVTLPVDDPIAVGAGLRLHSQANAGAADSAGEARLTIDMLNTVACNMIPLTPGTIEQTESGATLIPEPASLGLLALGGLALLRRRK